MVDFLIDNYGVPEPWSIGDPIYSHEPHNIQQYQVSPEKTIFMGRFVIRNLADPYETVMLPPAATTYSSLLGISLNTNSFHMVDIDSSTKAKAYTTNDIVPVGMLDCTLSVMMDMVIKDGTTDILTAPLAVLCTADNTAGKLYVGTSPPTGSIVLPADKFSLRVRQDISSDGPAYLYVKAGISGSGSSYTLPQATTTILGGVTVDGTTITATNGKISAVTTDKTQEKK